MSHRKQPEFLVNFVKQNRSKLSVPEGLLWRELKSSSQNEFKFRRQLLLLDRFIVDFVCQQASLLLLSILWISLLWVGWISRGGKGLVLWSVVCVFPLKSSWEPPGFVGTWRQRGDCFWEELLFRGLFRGESSFLWLKRTAALRRYRVSSPRGEHFWPHSLDDCS